MYFFSHISRFRRFPQLGSTQESTQVDTTLSLSYSHYSFYFFFFCFTGHILILVFALATIHHRLPSLCIATVVLERFAKESLGEVVGALFLGFNL